MVMPACHSLLRGTQPSAPMHLPASAVAGSACLERRHQAGTKALSWAQ